MNLLLRIWIACLAILALSVYSLSGQAPTDAAPLTGHIDRRIDVRYGLVGGEPLLLDAYIPDWGGQRRPAVIFIHGGGFRHGDKSDWANQAALIAGMGWVAFSIDYRLDVRAGFPAETDDCLQAVKWVRSHATEFGVDPARLGVVGGSAGATMAAMIATYGNGPLDVGSRVRVAVAWSAPMDMATMVTQNEHLRQTIEAYLGCSLKECSKTYVDASPITYVDSTDSPILIINSTDEVIPFSQAREMEVKLKSAGVPYDLIPIPGSLHAMKYKAVAWDPTVKYLEKYLGAPIPENAKSDLERSSRHGSIRRFATNYSTQPKQNNLSIR